MPVDLKKDDMGDVIKDFYKSDAPQFKGKSKKKRRQMAIAAKLSAESVLYFREAQRHWSKGYDSGDKTVPRRKALDRAEYFDNRGENERAHKIRRIAISKDHGDDYEARKKAKNIKISNKIGKLRPASIDDKRGAVSGDVQKKLKEQNFNAPGTTAIRFRKDFGLGSGGGSELKVTHGGADIYKRTTTNPKPAKTSPKDVVDTALSNFNNKVSEGKLVNEDIIDEGSSIIQGRRSSKKSSYRGPTGDHRRDEHGHIVASFYNKKSAPTGDKNKKTSYRDKPKRDLVAMRARKKERREKREARARERAAAAIVKEGKLDNVMDIVRKYSKKKEERKPQKAMDAGARAKRKLARKVHRSSVSDFIPDDIKDHKIWDSVKSHI